MDPVEESDKQLLAEYEKLYVEVIVPYYKDKDTIKQIIREAKDQRRIQKHETENARDRWDDIEQHFLRSTYRFEFIEFKRELESRI
jgi:hypothetical protein